MSIHSAVGKCQAGLSVFICVHLWLQCFVLVPGTKVGPYEILAPLGAGGMGEVYRARDTRLGRDVAIKVLPASFAADPDRLRRFELEARATGMLNHPNILAVYDIGTHEGSPYLVTELLEGQTLRDTMPVPRRKTLEYSRQIALGLSAAHAKGVTHRDLKPENIFVTTDGRVKILDFGLAKVAGSESTPDAATMSAATTPGVALGTVGYMSPEQVRGTPADARSDIFSLGVILYEMLSGQRAFHRDTGVETMSAILKEDPAPLADPALDRLVRQCMEKNPEERLQSARDLNFYFDALSGSGASAISAAAPAAATRARPWIAIVLAILTIAVAADLWLRTRPAGEATPFTGVNLGGSGIPYGPRVSPDGRTVAFQTVVSDLSQVAVMNPGSGNWTVLTHDRTRGILINLAWSPDSSKIYFDRVGDVPKGVFSVPALGGEERLVIEDAAAPEPMPDGTFLCGKLNAQGHLQLHRFWPQTGRLEPLNAVLSDAYFGVFRPFPDGKEVAYLGYPLDANASTPPHLYILDLATGKSRAPAPELVLHLEFNAGQPIATSSDGNQVLTTVRAGDQFRLVAIPRSGKGPVQTLMTLGRTVFFLDAGADGSIYLDQVERPVDALRFSVSGGAPERLAYTPAVPYSPYFPAVLPDGRVLMMSQFSGRKRLIASKPGQDGSPFVETDEETSIPMAVLGDKHVAFLVGSGANSLIAIATNSDGRIVRRLSETKGLAIITLAASPDGRTLYYASDGNIWAISAEGGVPRKVTKGDSMAPDPNGRELVVQRQEKDAARLFRVRVEGGEERPIPLSGDVKLFNSPISPDAVRADGRLALAISSLDSWWLSLGIYTPAGGRLEKLPVHYTGDIFAPGWTKDGRILAAGLQMRSSIWRFQREGKK